MSARALLPAITRALITTTAAACAALLFAPAAATAGTPGFAVLVAAADDGTPPTAPGTPIFSDVTPFSVTLTWTPATDDVAVSDYLVRQNLLGGQTWHHSTAGNVTTITIRDLTPNQDYTFTVIATDAAANTAASAAATVRTPPYLGGPMCSVSYQQTGSGSGSFSATVGMTNLSPGAWQEWTLGFTLGADQRINPAYGFRQDGTRWSADFIWLWSSGAGPLLPGNSRSVSFSGTYTGSGNPPPSDFTINDHPCGLVGQPVAPGQPQSLVAHDLTPGSVGVSWSAAIPGTRPISRYEVLVNGYSHPCTGVDPLACTISNLAPGTTYSIAVRAVDTAGLVGPAKTITVQTPAGAPGCDVVYRTNAWGTGFTSTVTIINTSGAAVNGWTLRFAFPAGQRLTHGWSAIWSQPAGSPNVSATGLSWNATIQPGGSVSIGFNGTRGGTDPQPTAFALNGNACAVS